MTKPTTDITAAPATPNLPSQHVDHAATFMNELEGRLFGFDSALATLAAEMSGMRIAHDQDIAERKQKFSDAMNEKSRLVRDMERGRKMALAGQQAYRDEIEPVASVRAGTDGDEA